MANAAIDMDHFWVVDPVGLAPMQLYLVPYALGNTSGEHGGRLGGSVLGRTSVTSIYSIVTSLGSILGLFLIREIHGQARYKPITTISTSSQSCSQYKQSQCISA